VIPGVTIADMQPIRELAAEQARTTAATSGSRRRPRGSSSCSASKRRTMPLKKRSSGGYGSGRSTGDGAPREHEAAME